ncbi:MAG: ribulokinase [Spirochaetia bacterium]|nr:ribulokinase [Spirochaetia bacterium]
MKKGEHYVLGADFGSDSVRVVVMDAHDGEVISSSVSHYKRWAQGLYCNPKKNQFRQHPLDYSESFTEAVLAATEGHEEKVKNLRAICVDTTGSTPVLCDEEGTPLALHEKYKENPDAMFILWKDHTAVKEADDFNHLSRTYGGVDYTQYLGGTYSSEWFWSKLLHIARTNDELAAVAASAAEHCDWFSAMLCGTTALDKIKRSRCAAGHKIAWHASWGGYPSSEFLGQLHPLLVKIKDSLGTQTYAADVKAGNLTHTWAKELNLPAGIPVCVGSYDAHIGAVGGFVDEGVMVKSIGTSTCDIIIGPLPKEGEKEKLVSGIAGQVDGSVIPGYIGYEAGQSAYGDFYAWFRDLIMWPLKHMGQTIDAETVNKIEKKVLAELEKQAEHIEVTIDSPLALDWINGRRSPHADQMLKGSITSLTLGTDAPSIMRSLLESTAFGARSILECFEEGGVRIDKIVAIGGVARKSILGMQILSDVTNREIHVTDHDQSPAIGAGVFASVVAGLYPDVKSAQKALCAGTGRVHTPNKDLVPIYNELYARYKKIGALEENIRRNK